MSRLPIKPCFYRFIITLIIVLTEQIAVATEQHTTLNDQASVAVTIYNENLALIKDQRKVTLNKGLNHLAYRGVSAKMRPETAMLRSLDVKDGFQVLEQNFYFDLLTPEKLLEHYVGRQVQIARMNPATGKQTIEKARVLSTNNGVVVKIADRIETNPAGHFIFDELPTSLRDEPTLVTQVMSPISKQQTLELSYLTGGLSWKADYVAELNADDSQLDLLGWVTLDNRSGTQYNQAKLQLVAGDVNRVQEQFQYRNKRMGEMALAQADMVAPMAEESLFEYHLYSLNRLTDIANNQSKQVSLLTASSIPVEKEFLLQGQDYYYHSRQDLLGQKLKVGVYVQFENRKKNGLGIPLPKGIVRVYKKDTSGNAQFIGEDRIDHTPKKEQVRLKLGNAFDITAKRKQTSFAKRTASSPFNYVFEAAYEIALSNAKSEAVTVVIREPIPGDWKMLKENHPHKKVASGLSQWNIKIPPESRQTLVYRVLVRY
ncbi:MAG TPA: DUF4139 domain-containing protein [Crenotrichaceae bacterium]|nr:DUF4139 domain-containing protein [Crenotrichaceae bacterium]